MNHITCDGCVRGSEGVSEVLRRYELEEGNGDATTSKTRIFLPQPVWQR